MTVVLIISAIVLLLVVDVLVLVGKLDFLIGRSLRLEMYGRLSRLRVVTALSVSLFVIPLVFPLVCEPASQTVKMANVLTTFVSILLGVLGNIWARRNGSGNDMNPIFVSRMMRNEKYNVSRMGVLAVVWTLVTGIGCLAVYFFCGNVLFWKVYFVLLIMVGIAICVLQATWAMKS